MNKKVKWVDVKNYEGVYFVSSSGEVKNSKGLILKQNPDHSGYLMVALCVNGKSKTKRVHRIVAESFLGIPNRKKEVNHINECKSDNNLCNLEWVTKKQNCNHGIRNHKMSKTKKSSDFRGEKISKLTNEDILWIRGNYKRGLGSKFAILFGISQQEISKIVLRKVWQHV